MSVVDWILGAEALFATGAAIAAVRHADAAGARSRKLRGRAAMWREISLILSARLDAEREANFFSTHLHRPRSAPGAQETSKPG